MKSEEKINLMSLDGMTEAYFVTEMDRLDYLGSALVNAYLAKDNFAEEFQIIKQKYPTFKWYLVTLSQLFKRVESWETVMIVLSDRAKAYKHALQVNFPNARLLFSQTSTLLSFLKKVISIGC